MKYGRIPTVIDAQGCGSWDASDCTPLLPIDSECQNCGETLPIVDAELQLCAACRQGETDYAILHGIICKHGVSESDECAECEAQRGMATAWEIGAALCDDCDSLGPQHETGCRHLG